MAIDNEVLEALSSVEGITSFKIEDNSSSDKLYGKVFVIEFKSTETLQNFILGASLSYCSEGYKSENFAYSSQEEASAKIELSLDGNKLCTGSGALNFSEISRIIRYLHQLGIEFFKDREFILFKEFKQDFSNPSIKGVKILRTIEPDEIHSHSTSASQSPYNLTMKNADRTGGCVVIECQNQGERDELANTILNKTKKSMPTDAETSTKLLNSSGLGIYVEGTDEAKRSIFIQRANYPRGAKADSDSLRNTPEINNAITTFNTHLSGKEQFKGGNDHWQVPEHLSKVTPPKGPFFLGAGAGFSAGVLIVQQVGLFGLIAGAGLFSSVIVAKVVALAAVLAVIALPTVVLGVAAYVAYGLFAKYSSCKNKVNAETPEESSGCSLFSSSTPSTPPR